MGVTEWRTHVYFISASYEMELQGGGGVVLVLSHEKLWEEENVHFG
jgi:hypothetical protein